MARRTMIGTTIYADVDRGAVPTTTDAHNELAPRE